MSSVVLGFTSQPVFSKSCDLLEKSCDLLDKPAARLLGSWEVVVSNGSRDRVGFSCN